MKTGKKIAVLLLVFVAAAVIYFIWPFGRTDDSRAGTVYTAMEDAAFPVVYPSMLGREMAPLFGHMEEMAVTADRDSLIILPEDRQLSIRMEHAEQVAGLRYEIRSLDMTHLVERTELSDWDAADGEIRTKLPVQNLMSPDVEYCLGINAILSDGTSLWYFTRIKEADDTHAAEMLALAEEFSSKTLDYRAAQDLTVYMESSPNSDNSSFGNVTLKNSFDLITWGKLGVKRSGAVHMTLKELSGDLANVQMEYFVTREEGGVSELFAVTENFSMKWTTQRVYMMDYNREMNQLFSGESSLYSGKRILLGIGNGRDCYAKTSESKRYTAFVTERELWFYDVNEGHGARIFAFGGIGESDVRANHGRHGIEILEVTENGEVDFLVYGYMNRGRHEGWTGISYCHYAQEENTLEERFFLPVGEPYELLKADMETLAHKGRNGSLYLLLNQSIYGIDLNSLEYVVVASELTNDRFAVSEDGSRAAWQERGEGSEARVLQIMDLDTGEKTQIGDGRTNTYQALGFVGSDCIYGVGSDDSYMMSNGRIMGRYLDNLSIVDKEMESVMYYERAGAWIRSVEVEESRIHIELVQSKENGFFDRAQEDTLVCNAEALPGKMDDIGWYASEARGRIYFVQLSKEIQAENKVRNLTPRELASDQAVTLMLEVRPPADTLEFYAYGRGRYLGRFVRFADAVAASFDSMGFVTAGRDRLVWARGNKANSYNIRDLDAASRRVERYRQEFEKSGWVEDDYLMLDASGCTLSQVLYFVGNGIPVLAYTGEGRFVYLSGYDRSHVRIHDPLTDRSETVDMSAAEEYLEALGNDYVCCVPTG